MTHRPLPLAAALLALAASGALAQAPAPAPADDVRAVLELFRSDLNAAKVAALDSVMHLTPAEAEAFWPIYRRYEGELAAVAERKLELMRDFLTRTAAGALDADASERLARGWLDVQQERLDLWRRYHKRLARAVSPVRAAQFLQVEHQVALFVDLNIAAEMPTVGR